MRIRLSRRANIIPRGTVLFERRPANCLAVGDCSRVSLGARPALCSANVVWHNCRAPVDSFLVVCRKTVTIEIVDRDQYQRNETFLVRLGEPSLVQDDDDDALRTC